MGMGCQHQAPATLPPEKRLGSIEMSLKILFRNIPTHPSTQPTQTETSNRFDMLTEEVSYPEPSDHPKNPSIPKPPLIFVHGFINYKDMIKSIIDAAEEE